MIIKDIFRNIYSWYLKPTSSEDLSIPRIIFYASLLIFHFLFDYRPLLELPAELWKPIGVLDLFFDTRPSPEIIGVLYWALPITLFTCTIGLFTRISAVFSFIFGLIYWGFGQSIGHMFRIDCLILMVMGVLCFAKMSESWSIDRLLFKSRMPSNHLAYQWPRKTIQLLYALFFFAAGFSKIYGSALLWLSGDFFRFGLLLGYISRNGYHEKFFWDGLGKELIAYPQICFIVSLCILTFELSMPFACFSERLKKVLFPISVIFPFAVFVTLGIPWFKYLAVIPFWLKWKRVAS